VFPPLPSHVVGALLAVLWTATAVTLLLRDRGRTLAKVAFVSAVLSPIVMGVHGLVTGGALDPLGLCYLPLALALALLLKGALGNGELLRLRRRHHLDEDAGLERSVRFAAGDRQASARR
jgi:hypothetical protein